MRYKPVVIGGFILLAVIGVFVAGAVGGYQRGARDAQTVAIERLQQADAIETRIMGYVLKRNPDAMYREFQDFPRILLTESQTAGIDFRIIMALIDKESQFNPRAVGKAGEIGLMQVLPSTGALVAKTLNLPFEPAKGISLGTLGVPHHNLRIGIRFLKDRVDEFGGVNATALRAYNRGSGTAREHRPWDRYAEDIALKYLTLVQETPLPKPQSAEQAPPPVPAPVSAAPEPSQQYTLVARTTERAWVRVTVDGNNIDETIPANAMREWKSNNPIIFSTGNAGGIGLEFNGKALGKLGEHGAVVTKLVLK